MSQASRSGWAQAHQKRQEEMVWFNPVQTLYLNMGLICSKDNSFIQTFIISDYASLPEHLWVSLLDLSPSVAQHLETFCKSWSAVCWCTWNKFTSNVLIDTLSPGSRVTIWCSFIVDGMAGLFDGILSVVRSTASASPKNTFNVVLVSPRALKSSCASEMFCSLLMSMSAVLYKTAPTPSDAPSPWLAPYCLYWVQYSVCR